MFQKLNKKRKETLVQVNDKDVFRDSLGPYASATATERTTPNKKCVSILRWILAFIWNYPVCLPVLKLAPAEDVAKSFNSK